MAKKKTSTEFSIEEKLAALHQLQVVDSQIDKIRTVRGELPLEVQDLEDEVLGLETRLEKIQSELDTQEALISKRKNKIEEANELVKKYSKQLDSIKNNREYDAISKEVESQELDTKIFAKKSTENEEKIDEIKVEVKETKKIIKETNEVLKSKKADLDLLSDESQDEEKKLASLKTKASPWLLHKSCCLALVLVVRVA